MLTKLFSTGLLIVVSCASAQTPVISGLGYNVPSVLAVAPGQVLTLFVTDIGKQLSDRPTLAGSPVPNTFAGISVTVTPGDGSSPLPAPILAAMLLDTCPVNRKLKSCIGTKIAAISVQIPFELSANDITVGGSAEAVLKVTEGGVSSTELLLEVVESHVHFIMGHHDLALDLIDGLAKGASVFHADGSPVSISTPARVGETLVVYGYGFGKPERVLRTGEIAREANPVPVRGQLFFSALLPTRSDGPTVGREQPFGDYISYFGVTPNTVGIYQMNFIVPPVSEGIRRCDATTPANLSVTFTEGVSRNNFAFCIEP
jgi:uncharacterized protein (TIGR03437 family)